MNSVQSLPLNTRFKLSNSVFHSCLQEDTVLLHLKSGTYFGLDPIGTIILNHLEKSQPIAEICDALMADYEVSEQDCIKAIQELIQDLLKADLIEVESEEAA